MQRLSKTSSGIYLRSCSTYARLRHQMLLSKCTGPTKQPHSNAAGGRVSMHFHTDKPGACYCCGKHI